MKNHYNALELDKNCTEKEIKDSYIKLTKKYHPDKNKSEDAKKKILEINEAYSVLKNRSTRLQYDQKLQHQNTQPRGHHDFHENNTRPYYRPYTYDEYTKYYQRVHKHVKVNSNGKFTVMFCCCMLMVFGAGLRLMYAWSEALRRKHLNEVSARHISEIKNNSENPELERIKQVWKRSHERQMKSKESVNNVQDD